MLKTAVQTAQETSSDHQPLPMAASITAGALLTVALVYGDRNW